MVSDEFRSHRELLANDIKRSGVEVCTQEDFANRGATTLDKLDSYLRNCHAVIHIVGDGLGHVPPAAAVDALLLRHPGFVAALAAYTPVTRELLGQCSYTQWEAYLAVFHNVRVHIYRPDAGAPRESGFVASDAHQALQAAHFERIRTLGRDRDSFLNAERLSSSVLADLNDILLPREQRPPDFSYIPRLPHAPRELIGRETWLAQLDAAWAEPQQHIVIVKAWGGTGKTALVSSWMAELEFKGWRGAERVFYWSFYSQGTQRAGEATASADLFIAKALSFFGDSDPTAGSPWDRGARLARLVGASKTLLVLDGLEPLQHPPGPTAGQITDPAIAALLSGLAAGSAGLCVVTTREPIPDLDGRLTVRSWRLDKLSEAAGAALLHHHGVRRAGPAEISPEDAELRVASNEVSGHALTLALMGRYLALACKGDIRQRDSFRLHEADPEWVTTDDDSPYGHAFKVMATYERWFLGPKQPWWKRWLGFWKRAESRKRAAGREQLGILRLLGLFNRPASADCLHALLQAPVIEHLSDDLQGITAKDWKIATQRLSDAGLLSIVDASVSKGVVAHSLDAHPLIREYFGQQLRTQHPQAFQAAHSRLFDHLCEGTPPRPDTLEGLQPLYQAVMHGCLAGRQQQACDKVYFDRILRGTGSGGYYSSNTLGAIGADLGAVAAFFEQPWTRLSPNLSEVDQAWLLNEAAFSLRALGRLSEAQGPMRVAGEMYVKNENWDNAVLSYSNLSELELTLGRLGPAVADARLAIDFAERSSDAFGLAVARTTAADALYQSGQPGQLAEARGLYAAAEALQRERQPKFDLLYSLGGFRYCDLILAPAERAAWQRQKSDSPNSASEIQSALAEATRRGLKMFEWRVPSDSLITIALDHLTLARVALYRAALTAQAPAANTNPHLAPALDGLRKAGTLDHLPKALLTAAHWHALIGDSATARQHLDETQQIAERGPMPLYLADVHLHRARLFCDTAELAKARALIDKHGYGRRREELADAEAAAIHWQP